MGMRSYSKEKGVCAEHSTDRLDTAETDVHTALQKQLLAFRILSYNLLLYN